MILSTGVVYHLPPAAYAASPLVIPAGLENDDTGGAATALSSVIRMQQVYPASAFPQRPIRITEIRWRPSRPLGNAFSTRSPDFSITLSTTTATENNLSRTFENNFSADKTVVFDGGADFSSQFTDAGGDSKAFDIVLPLQTPFEYDPAAGNFLWEIRNQDGAPDQIAVDASARQGDGASRIISFEPDGATAPHADGGADVMQLVFEEVGGPIAPAIVSGPEDRTVFIGDLLAFRVTATGTPPLEIQWFKDGQRVPGANMAVLTIADVTLDDAGTYTVTVANGGGSVTSDPAVVTVIDARQVIIPEGVANTDTGGAATALDGVIRMQQVYPSDAFPDERIRIVAIRWRLSRVFGQAFSTTVPSMRVTLSTTLATEGALDINFDDNFMSDKTVVFDGAAALQSQFRDGQGTAKEFDVVLTLQEPFFYNPSRGNFLFEIRNFQGAPADIAVDASPMVGDGAGRIISFDPNASTARSGDRGADVMQLIYEEAPLPPPVITAQPTDLTVGFGDPARFLVVAASEAPLAFQWLFNGDTIIGATGAELLIEAAAMEDAGFYSVVVANESHALTSQPAELVVTPNLEFLSALVLDAGLPPQISKPLLASLRVATASHDRGNARAEAGQLRAFQLKVKRRVTPIDPDLAARWIATAQMLIDRALP